VASIPRDALERVLARATQLQGDSPDAPEVVSDQRLMEIAREVGIDPSHLQQALAEERARLPMQADDQGLLLDALGSATLSAQRIVAGTPADVLAKLDAWMPRMEMLTLMRRAGDRVSWEPRRDAMGNFLRSIGLGGRRFDLVRLDHVVASVTPVDATRSVVRFDVSSMRARRTQRNSVLAIGLVLGMVSAGVAIPLTLLAAGTSVVGAGLAGLGLFAAGGIYATWRAIRRGYREMTDRAQLRLEQMLDELENGGMQPPPSLARQVTAALLR
jgi:hypothetical protein